MDPYEKVLIVAAGIILFLAFVAIVVELLMRWRNK